MTNICPCGIGPDSHTHNAEHAFERAGLGKAPYTYTGFEAKTYHACHGAPIQVGGSCDYCATGIINMFWFRSADGKTFKVGSDCVRKAGDRGMVNTVRKVENKIKTAARHAKETEAIDWAITNIDAFKSQLEVMPSPNASRAQRGDTALGWAQWMLANAGNAGKMSVVKFLHKLAAKHLGDAKGETK